MRSLGFASPAKARVWSHRGRRPWAGSCREVVDFVRQHAINAIYIALPISSAPRIAELLQQLRDTTASIYFVPNIFVFDLVQPRCVEIHGIPALAVCETPHQGMCGLRKRATDIVLGVLAATLAGPLFEAWLDSGDATAYPAG